jgi:hypothetical protein
MNKTCKSKLSNSKLKRLQDLKISQQLSAGPKACFTDFAQGTWLFKSTKASKLAIVQ